uniref:Chromosome 15 open reading frame 39 n=1 Tax=Anolis carolinensis TaxID=28377 RepID=H9GP07_ANOCA
MGTVSCSKLPRLMSEPDQHLATDFCKSSVVPNHASESYYGYKGSYFTYPLRYHDGPKPLTHWTPPEAYPHCVAGTASHQLQTETALCMLYKQEAESFVARGQTLGHEKSGECASRNAFNAQERWAGYMGYPGYIPQGWIHSYMAQQSPRAPLAMPKPIYQHHVYNTESGYSLKSSLDLGMVTESALKPLEWALPPSGHLNCVDTHKIESGACIIISDSPGTPNNSCCKTTQQALDVQEVLTPSLHNGPQSPQGREKSVIKGPEIPQLPPSPPMPVINNVFSLAPYRDYLEETNRKELSNSCIKRENGDVLDLSCKTETLADNVSHPKGSSKSNGAEVGIVSSNGREVLPETNRPASELPVQSSSEKRGNFQSSATFLFKKFKIRRSPATEVGSIVQQTPSLSPTSQIAAPPRQGVTQQSISPVQDVTQQSCLQVATQPETMQRLQLQCINIQLPDMSKVLLPSTTAVSPVLGTANISPPASDKPPEQQSSPGQYFTDLHSSVCTVISCSVSASSPEQLKEWLEKGKQVWLAFKDVVALFRKLLSQLDTFLLTHKCPFPHVVRAGAIFIPIHVVKEKLFPNLPGTSVDHVLQNHKYVSAFRVGAFVNRKESVCVCTCICVCVCMYVYIRYR